MRLTSASAAFTVKSTMLSHPIPPLTKKLRLVPVLLIVCGCDDKNTSSTTTDCVQGAERCACYPNKTCNEGLLCLSDICVASFASGGATSTLGSDTLSFGGTATGPSGEGGVGASLAAEVGGTSATGTFVAPAVGGATETRTTATVSTGGTGSTSGSVVATGGGGVSAASLVPAGGLGGMGGTGGQGEVAGATGVTGPNLIKDGSFLAFESYWNAILQEGDSGTYTHPPTAAAVCVTNTSLSTSLYYELSFTVGYPNSTADTFVIEPGATYSLSYTVSATYPLDFEVKIGHSVSPWTEVYAYSSDVLTASYKTFTHQFTSVAGDSSAGLAFNAVLDLYGKMCFQQVSLVRIL